MIVFLYLFLYLFSYLFIYLFVLTDFTGQISSRLSCDDHSKLKIQKYGVKMGIELKWRRA